jgi:predicted Zn-dependent peptidase
VTSVALENGLTIVLHEDHKTPLVAVIVTYNVGSKDDPPGRTGFAHLFEHMIEIFKEMTDLAGTNPVNEDGIVQIHDGMVAPWFERVETIAGFATEIDNMVTYHLPRNHFATEFDRYAAVTQTGTKWAATR